MDAIISDLLANSPGIAKRWRKHLAFWRREEAGIYNDLAVFAHHAVESFSAGQLAEVAALFAAVEEQFQRGDASAKKYLQVGFLEDVQSIASHQPFGAAAFEPFLGPATRGAWQEIREAWRGKSSLAEIIRSEFKS